MTTSVLIAHFNNHIFFKDCYLSLLQQTYGDFEIVILDDCSNMESFKAIVELTENNPKVRIFRNSQNRGVGYTKKKLLELAHGEFLAFIDPDDAITANALQSCVKNLQENIKSIAVYSMLWWCSDSLNPKHIFKSTRKIRNGDPMFFNLKSEVAHLFVFRRSAYLKTEGINENLSSAVDQDLYLKLYEIGEFKFIRKPLYYYRAHDKGVSQDKVKKTTLRENWNTVLSDTAERRKIAILYGKKVSAIPYLPEFIYNQQNTFLRRLLRKLSW